jgi:hypothetical protein
MHLFYSGFHLICSTKDVCDCYLRIVIQLKRDDLPIDEHNCLVMEKETHLDAAIGQRRMVSNFMKEFVRHHAPD